MPDAREVQVAGLVAVVVADVDAVAAAARPTGPHDGAAGHGEHRGAGRRSVVHAAVGARGTQHRVHAAEREPRGHPRFELERRLQEEAAHRAAVAVVVVGLLSRHGVAERLEALAAGREARRDDVAVAAELAFTHDLLEQDLERIARLQFVAEVDLALEHAGEVERQANPFAGRVHRGDQRRRLPRDLTADRHQRAVLLVRHHLHVEARRGVGVGLGGADDLQELVGVDLVGELANRAVQAHVQRVRPVGADAAEVELLPRARHEVVDDLVADLVGAEQTGERGVTRDAGLDEPGRLLLDVHRGKRRHGRLGRPW